MTFQTVSFMSKASGYQPTQSVQPVQFSGRGRNLLIGALDSLSLHIQSGPERRYLNAQKRLARKVMNKKALDAPISSTQPTVTLKSLLAVLIRQDPLYQATMKSNFEFDRYQRLIPRQSSPAELAENLGNTLPSEVGSLSEEQIKTGLQTLSKLGLIHEKIYTTQHGSESASGDSWSQSWTSRTLFVELSGQLIAKELGLVPLDTTI